MTDSLRGLAALLAALLLTLASFWMMMRMVSAPAVERSATAPPVAVSFLRRPPPPEVEPVEPRAVDRPPAQPPQPMAAIPQAASSTPAAPPMLPRLAVSQLALPSLEKGFDFKGKPLLGSMLPAPAPAPAPALAPAEPVPVQPLMVLRRVPPLYPRRALRRKQQGWVEVALTVAADGSVTAARVLRSEPTRVFDQAALKAVRRWRFQPRDGAAPVSATQKIDFRLERS